MSDEPIDIPSAVPLFPLPEVVLFPRSVLPLHVFEPRYRKLTADVLAGAGILAVTLLKPGFERHYYTLRAPVHSIIGVGQIIASEQVEDGNYNVLLRGVARARIVEEVPHRPYRIARIEPLLPSAAQSGVRLKRLRRRLHAAVADEFVGDHDVRRHWLRLIDSSLELGDLADLIASGLPVEAELRQALLAEVSPAQRAAALIEHIRTLAAVTRTRRSPSPNADWTMN